MAMGNLWQFFGLPDPDAGGAARDCRCTFYYAK